MNPRPIIAPDVAYWADANPEVRTFTSPAEIDAGVEPCVAVVTDDPLGDEFGRVVRVPWQLSEIDLVHLANGGTLWLSTWGGLPMHHLHVQVAP